MIWDEETVNKLRSLHGTMSIAELAEKFGTSKASIRAKITRLGIAKKENYSDAVLVELKEIYRAAGPDGVVSLEALSKKSGISNSNLCRKARLLGLPINQKRKKVKNPKGRPLKYTSEEDRSRARSKTAKEYIATHGHPKGMAGKRHSEKTKRSLSKTTAAWNKSLTSQQRSEHTQKAIESKVAKYGTLAPNVQRGNWKAGWREFGGKRNYYRSRWEANYGRYLEWLKCQGQIKEWEHEPETFWFDAIKRGTRSYLPDFRVTENNEEIVFHEVKGWMDDRSKTKIRRMAKYHPLVKLIVIQKKEYTEIKKKLGGLINGWE